MDSSKWIFSLVLLLCSNYVHGQTNIFSVRKFGAIADGKTDNSKAFLSAWKEACETRGGSISVPSGTYSLSGATFEGPCNGETHFEIQGTLRASPGPHSQDYWISFRDVDGLKIYGRGTFDGNGASAWLTKKSCGGGKCGRGTSSIKIAKAKNVEIHDISSLNSKQFHFHVVDSENLLMNNLNIVAPGQSPNTDGIHVGRSKNVAITNSRIGTGDDCVSLGDGNNDIRIESVMCGPGHGISIGSLGKYSGEEDVRGITVKNCTLTDTTNGLRIKTWAPSTVSTTVSDVTFENIYLNNVKNPIIIDQFYCLKSPCSHQKDSSIKINGVKFINVKGTSKTPVAVSLQCSSSQPCENIEMDGVRVTTAQGQSTSAICSNANFKSFDVNGNHGACSKLGSRGLGAVLSMENRFN